MKREAFMALLHSARVEFADKVAVIEDAGLARCDMTYKDLWSTSCLVSETISQFCTARTESSQFVGVCIDQCLVFPAIILGVLQHGYGFACIEPSWMNDKQTDYLRKLGAQLVIHNDKERITGSTQQWCQLKLQDTVLYFERLDYDRFLRECPHPMAYAVLTSGSTGKPKIVRVPHQSIASNLIALRKILAIVPEDVIFLSSPSTFDPCVVDMFLAFTTGATLLITSKSIKTSAAKLLQVLFPPKDIKGVSVLQTTPSLFNRWSEKELREVVLGSKTSLKVLLLGGEPFLSYSKLKRCRDSGNQTRIYNIYGITEVSAWASIHEISFSSSDSSVTLSLYEQDQVPLGRALPDTVLCVKDCATNTEVKSGKGEMYIGSLRRICEIDDENCQEYSFPVLRPTGDIVEIRPDGNIFYIGRSNLMVKRWGHRVNLENIEHIALRHPSVKSAVCFLEDISQKIYLIVDLQADSQVSDLHSYFVQSGCGSLLIPDYIQERQYSNLTQHGKVNRQVSLEELVMKSTSKSALCVEGEFSNILCRLLGLKTLQNGSFLDAGGDSLLAIIIISELERAFKSCPDDLADMLLSGKSLQHICERLSRYYQEAASPPFHSHGAVEEKPQDSSFTQNNLMSISLLKDSYSGEIPAFCLSQINLVNLKMAFVWKVNLGKCIDSSPLCVIYERDKICLVIGSHSGMVCCVDGMTGEVRWSLNMASRIESTASCSACGQYVYVGCYSGILHCIDVLNGREKWTFTCKAQRMKGLPVLCNGGTNVMFGSYDNNVYCISSESGELVWSFSEPDTGHERAGKGNWHASPIVVGELAILCCLSGNVYAVLTKNKAVIWSISLKNPIFSTPVHYTIDSGTYVIIAQVKGSLHCVNALTGEEVWHWDAPGYVYAPLTIVNVTSQNTDARYKMLVSCYDSFLYCFSVNNVNQFSLEWTASLGSVIGSAACPFNIRTSNCTDNLCAVVSNKDGIVFLVSLETGAICCKYDIGAEVFAAAVVYGNRVYLGCRDDHLYSLIIEC